MAPGEQRVSRYVQPADMWSQLQPVLDGVTTNGASKRQVLGDGFAVTWGVAHHCKGGRVVQGQLEDV